MSKYIWQPLMLMLYIAFMLSLFYWHATSNILWAVGAGSLASSAYIVFSKPSSIAAKPMKMIVAYVVAICVGIFFRFIVENWLVHCVNFYTFHRLCWPGFIAAIAVTISMLVMTQLHAEHPPAAGVALVLVVDVKDYQTLIVILGSVMVLSVLYMVLRPFLVDLF